MRDVSLVLGGTGFLGYNILLELSKRGKKIRSFGIDTPTPGTEIGDVEYIVGDVFNEHDLSEAMKDVKDVYCFISTSMPNSGSKNLENEIKFTLQSLDHVLTSMVNCGARRIVYPSSGGAIYGNQSLNNASESSPLLPSTTYGVGKQMCEDMLGFYHRLYGIDVSIFRIGNVYGSKQFRKVQQGVIDVFVQSALLGEEINIWGDASKAIRDYIFLDDAVEAIVSCVERDIKGYEVYNIGTGIGVSVSQIVNMIQNKVDAPLNIKFQPERSSGVNYIVLDCSKIEKTLNWKPQMDIDTGISHTIEIKRELLRSRGKL